MGYCSLSVSVSVREKARWAVTAATAMSIRASAYSQLVVRRP
ncbi:hypothetical protein ACIQMV_30905 [Streptomyces sp. NPDC091412]